MRINKSSKELYSLCSVESKDVYSYPNVIVSLNN